MLTLMMREEDPCNESGVVSTRGIGFGNVGLIIRLSLSLLFLLGWDED